MTAPSWSNPLSIGLMDSNSNLLSFVASPGGFQLPVSPPSSVLLSDTFDGATIDTAYRWNAPVLAGAGTLSQVAGNLVAATGTTANNGAAISSIEQFTPTIGNLTAGALLQIEAAPATNTHRAFGFYTRPGSFTAATPVQDGYVWEYDIAGALRASIYNGGTRVFSQTFPLQSTYIPVAIGYQGLNVYFFINNFAVPALTVPVIQPGTLMLPFGFHCINHTAGPAAAPTWLTSAMAVIDAAGASPSLWNGQCYSRARSPGKFISVNALSIAAEATVWTPASGRRFRLLGYELSSTGAQNIVLKDGTAGATILVIPGLTPGQLNYSPDNFGNGILSAAANNVLTANAGGVNALSGFFFGTEE